MLKITTGATLAIGDRMTFAGLYQRRTLREWITRKPRALRQFVVTGEAVAGMSYDIEPAPNNRLKWALKSIWRKIQWLRGKLCL